MIFRVGCLIIKTVTKLISDVKIIEVNEMINRDNFQTKFLY